MGNYSNIKESIQNAIYENSVGAVTGGVLQNILTAMVNAIGLNSNFMGFLSSGNKPTSPVDGKQFYIGCNESSTPLSVDLSGVDLGTLTINKGNLYVVYSGSTGWQVKDMAAGIVATIPTHVYDLIDGDYYDPKPGYLYLSGNVEMSSMKSNMVYYIKDCSSLVIDSFDYDLTDDTCFSLPQTIIIIEASVDLDITVSGLKTLNGTTLHCEAGETYLLTIKGRFAKLENYA